MGKDGRNSHPLVSIIIPHIGSTGILTDCLRSVSQTTYPSYDIVVVDNSLELQPETLPGYGTNLKCIHNSKNLGFAGGCNVGIKAAQGEYVVILNNDTVVDSGWLEPLIETMEKDHKVAACQSRLLSKTSKGKLDYAGAMGGLIDIFGYPFALGRLFDTLENNESTYPGKYDIFWASGTAAIWRKSAITEVGLFDEDFFAHMEEIDLSWRLHLRGYGLQSSTDSKVYHFSGYSLGHDHWRKMYLNHRNSLVMLLKNYQLKSLLWIYPVRLVLEFVTAIASFLSFNWKRTFAVLLAQIYLIGHLVMIARKRGVVQKLRTKDDSYILKKMYFGSVVWQYYIRRKRKVTDFLKVKCL